MDCGTHSRKECAVFFADAFCVECDGLHAMNNFFFFFLVKPS